VTDDRDPFDPSRRARGWRRFADACRDRSPLYARLSLAIADELGSADAPVDDLLRAAPTPQLAHPTLLFAAVHDLLLAGTPAPALVAHYPSLPGTDTGTGARTADADPWPAFQGFCREHRPEIERRVRDRRTQTNEVGRSTALLVGLDEVARDVGRPLAWLDVGTSAGLTMRLDQYLHDLGDGRQVGDATSLVHLTCELRGRARTPLLPAFAWRGGLDAAPVDVGDPDDRRWLEACVWPEQTDRLDRLRAALTVAASAPLPVRRGDAVTDLLDAAGDAPDDAALVVTHTWVLAYLSPDGRAAFEAALDELGAVRDLDRIGMEGAAALPVAAEAAPGTTSVLLRTRWRGGRREDAVLADVDDHGRWMSWREEGDARDAGAG
jgi:hypothetical protein